MGEMEQKRTAFHVDNGHAPGCGQPPDWPTAQRELDEARSYFENVHGEQWVASATARLFQITGGDIGWKTRRVEDPNYVLLAQAFTLSEFIVGFDTPASIMLHGLILSGEECAWLRAFCLMASHRWPR